MTQIEHYSKVTSSIEETDVPFLFQTDGIDNYWTWLEGTVLPSISSSNRDWAAGCHPLQEYTIDCNSRLVGGARVRQLRISPGIFITDVTSQSQNTSVRRTCRYMLVAWDSNIQNYAERGNLNM